MLLSGLEVIRILSYLIVNHYVNLKQTQVDESLLFRQPKINYPENYSCSKYFSITVMADSEMIVPGPKIAATFLSNK